MKKSRLIAMAALPALAISACGAAPDDQDAGDPSVASSEIAITVGAIPIADTAPLWLGVEKGFFAEEGLDVTIEPTTGGAVAVAGVVSGSYDFAFGNYVSLMVARDQGLDLRYVTNGNSTAGNPDFGAVVVPADSPIQTAADLAGRTVGVVNVTNIGDVTIRGVVGAAGGDQTSIEFVEIAFPDAEAALDNGNVEAVWILEPFLHSALANGKRVVTYNFSEFHPELDISGYFTASDTIESEPDLVDAFTTAMERSLEYADGNPDEVRQIVGTYTEIGAEQLQEMVLPEFRPQVSREALTELGAALLEYEMVSEEPDLDELLP